VNEQAQARVTAPGDYAAALWKVSQLSHDDDYGIIRTTPHFQRTFHHTAPYPATAFICLVPDGGSRVLISGPQRATGKSLVAWVIPVNSGKECR
jgi:hypothetical protein